MLSSSRATLGGSSQLINIVRIPPPFISHDKVVWNGVPGLPDPQKTCCKDHQGHIFHHVNVRTARMLQEVRINVNV